MGQALRRSRRDIAGRPEGIERQAMVSRERQASGLAGPLKRAPGDAAAPGRVRNGEGFSHGRGSGRVGPEVGIEHLRRRPGAGLRKGRQGQTGFVGGVQPSEGIPARQQPRDLWP